MLSQILYYKTQDVGKTSLLLIGIKYLAISQITFSHFPKIS